MATYTISSVLVINRAQLTVEITAALSAPVSVRETITSKDVVVVFAVALSAGDQTILATTIADHIPAFAVGLDNCKKFLGVDADNAGYTTASIISGADIKEFGVYVSANTGAHSNHIVRVQISPDNSTWFDTTHVITGIGFIEDVRVICEFIRLEIQTAEGATSTVDITIIGE